MLLLHRMLVRHGIRTSFEENAFVTSTNSTNLMGIIETPLSTMNIEHLLRDGFSWWLHFITNIINAMDENSKNAKKSILLFAANP